MLKRLLQTTLFIIITVTFSLSADNQVVTSSRLSQISSAQSSMSYTWQDYSGPVAIPESGNTASCYIYARMKNEDGTVQVYDPTSPDVSEHPWAPATLAASCDNLYALSTADNASDSTE